MRSAWLRTRQDRAGGFAIVELLLAISVFALLVAGIAGATVYGNRSVAYSGENQQASLLADEGIQAVRNIRNNNFNLLDDGTYGLAQSGGRWILSGSSDASGIFTRRVTITSADQNRRDVTVSVSWPRGGSTASVEQTTRLTYWMATNPVTWSGVTVQGVYNAGTTALKVRVVGDYAFVVFNSTSNNFRVFQVGDSGPPSLVATRTTNGTPYNIYVEDGYAYISSNDNSNEVRIWNVSTPTNPTAVGTVDLPSTTDTRGVFVSGNTLYATRLSSSDRELYAVNVTNKSSPSVLGSLELGNNTNDVYVSGNYAFLASASNTQEVQVVNITNPASMSLVESLNLGGTTDALTISGRDTVLYISNGKYLVTVDIATPTNISQLDTLNASGTVNDISINSLTTLAFMGTSSTSAELRIGNITDPSDVISEATYNVANRGALNGVAFIPDHDRLIGVGSNSGNQVVIFQPN